MDENECRRNPGTCIQITALDAIVNVNSLFTIAVFIGLALNPTDGTSNLVQDPSCIAGQKIAEDFVAFHVFSFSSFLFSSLVAKGIKQVIKSADSTAYTTPTAYVNKSVLRGGMLVSAVGSVCGSGFLMLALVNMLQIKLGTLACGSSATISAVVPLVILADGAGECGKSSAEIEAYKLAPCAYAAQDEKIQVSSSCCSQVQKIGQNPSCLCAVMLSNTAKSSGVKTEIAITIPKRCNLANRPIGFKCGAYTLP